MMKIKLAALRVNAGLSQEMVAEAIHVGKGTIGKWERYETFPTLSSLQKLCDLYHCNMDDVFVPEKALKSDNDETESAL